MKVLLLLCFFFATSASWADVGGVDLDPGGDPTLPRTDYPWGYNPPSEKLRDYWILKNRDAAFAVLKYLEEKGAIKNRHILNEKNQDYLDISVMVSQVYNAYKDLFSDFAPPEPVVFLYTEDIPLTRGSVFGFKGG